MFLITQKSYYFKKGLSLKEWFLWCCQTLISTSACQWQETSSLCGLHDFEGGSCPKRLHCSECSWAQLRNIKPWTFCMWTLCPVEQGFGFICFLTLWQQHRGCSFSGSKHLFSLHPLRQAWVKLGSKNQNVFRLHLSFGFWWKHASHAVLEFATF